MKCKIKNCENDARLRVKFGPPKIEEYDLCEQHAEKMIHDDLEIDHWATPEIVKEYYEGVSC